MMPLHVTPIQHYAGSLANAIIQEKEIKCIGNRGEEKIPLLVYKKITKNQQQKQKYLSELARIYSMVIGCSITIQESILLIYQQQTVRI